MKVKILVTQLLLWILPFSAGAAACEQPLQSLASTSQSVLKLSNAANLGTARATYYCPKNTKNIRLEGGEKNRFGEPVRTIEDQLRSADVKPVTVAADYKGRFGKACNRRNQRCLLQLSLPAFDRLYPAYHKRVCGLCEARGKRCQLPPNTFIAIVEDTGGAFIGKGSSRFDLATNNEKFCSKGTGSSDRLSWRQINPSPSILKGPGGRNTSVADLACGS